MQVHIVNTGFGTDEGYREVNVESLKLDHSDRPYAIITNPYSSALGSLRAEFNGTEWVVDLD